MEKRNIGQEKKRGAPGKIVVLNQKELLSCLKKENDLATKFKLCALNLVANNRSPREVAKELVVSYKSIYNWIGIWNKKGLIGLKEVSLSPGRPPQLDGEKMENLKKYLKDRPFWTTKEVRLLIREKFDIELSEDQTRRILRDKLKMTFSKPYPEDYRRPEDAEEILANNLETVMKLLKEKGIKEEEIAIGFADESSPQLTANTVRVWSFGKVKITKNTGRIKSNTIGFYAIRGKSVSSFLNGSKAKDIAGFLEEIREDNKKYKAIVVVLDNFSPHKSKVVKEKAEKLSIYFVWLPPYSPKLNPIEFLWKSIKRVISLKLIKHIDELRNTIKENFQKFAVKMSYAKSWIEKFMGKYKFV